mgnify:CR=1 FL=1
MSAYFQDIRSNVVLKFEHAIDIKGLREQISDYKEVTEKEYNEYHGIVETKQPSKPTK